MSPLNSQISEVSSFPSSKNVFQKNIYYSDKDSLFLQSTPAFFGLLIYIQMNMSAHLGC